MLLVKNPILLGIFSGIAASYFTVPLAPVLVNLLTIVSQSASFLALFALGISLADRQLQLDKQGKTELTVLIMIKSIIQPILAFVLGTWLFHLQGFWLQALVLACTMPTAKNLFIFAQNYQIGVARSQWVVFSTTVFSLVSINIVLWIFAQNPFISV